MTWALWIACAAAIAYQMVALAAVLRHLFRHDPPLNATPPPVSILKPVHGHDSFFDGAIHSHTRIEYPNYELLFGVGDLQDAAVPVVSAVPGSKLIVRDFDRPNAKAASLIAMSREARGEIWVVNDGDIRVTPDYLRCVVAPLMAHPSVGVVTCLYRAIAEDLPGRWEALGIATEFAPSTLVAPLVGINEFGLGSTLCFRAADLRQAGGFEPISSYLADDYQLARRLTRGLGKRSWMSRLVVDTHLGYASWRGVWRHQVRWARTIRVSRGDGYLGLPITYAALWALVALLAGQSWLALAVVSSRIAMGFAAGALLIKLKDAWMLPLIPLWDLWAFAVWIAGLRGDRIEWRGRLMRLHPDGRLSGD